MSKHLLTLSLDNKFSFRCPIFDADTKMVSCLVLRDLVWGGMKPTMRHGCQVAMRCSKCPAARIVDAINYRHNGDDNDRYGSMEPVMGKLRTDILEKILPVMLQDRFMREYPISDRERELLLSANERITQQLGGASIKGEENATRYAPRKQSKRAADPKKVSTAVTDAARLGDLSAAINA